jgi:transposase
MSLVSKANGLPVMYRAYPGSINDVSTFMETASEMEVVGPDVMREFVSDSGYFANFNMARLIGRGDDFTIEGKWNKQTLLILEEKRQLLASHGEYVTHGSYAYRYEPCEYKVFSKEAGMIRNPRLHILF